MCRVELDMLRGNRLLSGLDDDVLRRLGGLFALEDVKLRRAAYENGGPLRWIAFPPDAEFSLVTTADEQRVVEVATVGNEGFSDCRRSCRARSRACTWRSARVPVAAGRQGREGQRRRGGWSTRRW